MLAPLALRDMQGSTTGHKSPVLGHDDQGRPVPAWNFTDATAGAGAIVSDARSLARIAQAALGVFEQPVREAFALCLRRHADGPAPINPIGLAWVLAPLAAAYALGPQFKLMLRADGSRLFAQATGQGEFELFRKARTGGRRFFARVTALEIEFDGTVGAPPALTLNQGGQQLRFVRE